LQAVIIGVVLNDFISNKNNCNRIGFLIFLCRKTDGDLISFCC